MPKLVHRALSPAEVAAARPDPGGKTLKLNDGGSLRLNVRPNGKKVWTARLTRGGKDTEATLGEYPEMSLAAARLARDRALVDDRDVRRRGATFEEVFEDWYAANLPRWRPGHAEDIRERLAHNAVPAFGSKSISAIDKRDVIDLVQKIDSHLIMRNYSGLMSKK
jgi:hypothetical protein